MIVGGAVIKMIPPDESETGLVRPIDGPILVLVDVALEADESRTLITTVSVSILVLVDVSRIVPVNYDT